jgi:hypothetical protein
VVTNYVEAQVHGGVTMDDVEEVVFESYSYSGPFQEELDEMAKKLKSRYPHLKIRRAKSL